jgi:predicted secreted hydrolase
MQLFTPRYYFLRSKLSFIKLALLAISISIFVINPVAAEDFERAQIGYKWKFPEDHGAHPQYHLDWWYYTGQLYSHASEPFRDKPEYGFQLTFFRKSDRVSGRYVSEYLAHAALTDLARGETYFSSRIGGGALGLATVSSDSLAATSGDWSVDPIGKQLVLRFSVNQGVSGAPVEIRILTGDLNDIWLQGEGGFSRKASCELCASMYYSIPQIKFTASINGLVDSAGRVIDRRNLHGIAWMDHEFMTNSLDPGQVGWDWFGLMLKDGRSLTIFELRNSKGEANFVSASIRNGSESRSLRSNEFSITPLRRWKSAVSGAQYPVEWRILIPSAGIDTVIKARTDSCEVGAQEVSKHGKQKPKGETRYWEGPVAAEDESILGYLEMTGYAEGFEGVLSLSVTN